MSFRFARDFEVRWKDVDAAGVLNNAVYLTFLEQARYHYFEDLGLLRGHQFPFLLGETRIRFERPALPGTTVTVHARVSRLGGKSLDMEYELHDGDGPLARASATLVWVDEQLASAPIPPEARARVERVEGRVLRGGESSAVPADDSGV